MKFWHTKPAYARTGASEADSDIEFIDLSQSEADHDLVPGLTSNRPATTRIGTIRSQVQKRFAGWRAGALLAACGVISCFLINLVALAWTYSQDTHITSHESGLVNLFEGNCDKVHQMSLWSHLAINILSTLMLSGSSYCMQCLCAPTRKAIDTAHSQGKFLDVGILSLRNLRSIPRRRRICWVLLAASSVPLHLLYNSACYSVVSTNDYAVYLIASESDFMNQPLPNWGGDYPVVHQFLNYDSGVDRIDYSQGYSTDERSRLNWSQITTDLRIDLREAGRFQRLENSDCIKAYAEVLNPTRKNLVIVTTNVSADANNSIFAIADYQWSWYAAPSEKWFAPYLWICSDPIIASKIDIPPEFIRTGQRAKDDNVQIDSMCFAYVSRVEEVSDTWAPLGYKSEYCLSESVPETCAFVVNTAILIVVIICNMIKVAIMLLVAFTLHDKPLMTIGDAVSSFLSQPDQSTVGRCLLNKKDVVDVTRGRPQDCNIPWAITSTNVPAPKTYNEEIRLRYCDVGGRRRWIWTTCSIVLAVGMIAILLHAAVTAVRAKNADPWAIGFGAVNVQAIINGWAIDHIRSPSSQITAAALAANSPQFILSIIYFNINGLLTSVWQEREWNEFAAERKTLRVSNPQGIQRSTHFLQLPYRAALPLICLSGILHWLVSQSIFLTAVQEYDVDGTIRHAVAVASCGFSPRAMVSVLAIAGVVALVLILMGLRRVVCLMPLAGSCSVVISAACHAPNWDTDAAIRPVSWGAISDGGKEEHVGHCCFTSGEVNTPVANKSYAGHR